jgi:hypothetical protein
MITYQNCGQTEQSNLFGSNCNGEKCTEDPDSLDLELDLQLVPGGVFKISTNPSSGFTNLRLTGSCEAAGFNRTLVKAKLYQCIGSSCTTLKHLKAEPCSQGRYEIASTVTNLTPGPHRLNLEIVGIDEFGQEVYGRNSKLPAIAAEAKQTINPPILASFSGTNFWAQDKIYKSIISHHQLKKWCSTDTLQVFVITSLVTHKFQSSYPSKVQALTNCWRSHNVNLL